MSGGARLTVGLVGAASVLRCQNMLRGEEGGVLIVYSVNESTKKCLIVHIAGFTSIRSTISVLIHAFYLLFLALQRQELLF